jgi:hypothetical protein
MTQRSRGESCTLSILSKSSDEAIPSIDGLHLSETEVGSLIKRTHKIANF